MSEQNITNIFNVSGHHNSVTFSQVNSYSEANSNGADAGQLLQIVLGFIAMILLSPVWVPLLLAEYGRKQLSSKGNDYAN